MNIYINEDSHHISSNLRLNDAIKSFNLDGDIYVLNGYQLAGENPILEDGDRITVIKKGVLPTREELKKLICARHTPGVFDRVSKSRVAIAGLGGLGSNVAIALSRIGCGYLRLIDYDVVEPSNINRQYYMLSHIGQKKTTALKAQIQQINPFITVDSIDAKVTCENISSLFNDIDIIVEAFDNPCTKATIVEQLLIKYPDTPIVASSGMAGYYSNNIIRTRKLMKNLYMIGDGLNEAKPMDGLMAPRVLIVAGHQANTVLRIIMNESEV